MNEEIKAVGYYILATVEGTITKSGMIIGEKDRAVVHSIGKGVTLNINKGDVILMHKNAGLAFHNYVVLSEEDIIAVVSND